MGTGRVLKADAAQSFGGLRRLLWFRAVRDAVRSVAFHGVAPRALRVSEAVRFGRPFQRCVTCRIGTLPQRRSWRLGPTAAFAQHLAYLEKTWLGRTDSRGTDLRVGAGAVTVLLPMLD